jgi:predicted transcriptional regulator
MDDPHARSLHDVPNEDAELAAQLDAKAEADIAAGRVVPHAKVAEWLNSWGTDKPLPRPKPERR